jgi:hypothetical protein
MNSITQSTPDAEIPAVKPGNTRQGRILLGLVLGSILLDFLYCRHMVSGLINPDAMDFAQCARNLLQGHGFTTQILSPLALTHSSKVLQQPEMIHGVFYPFLLALGFGIFGAKDAVVIALSGLFYVLTVPVIYFLGRRLFNVRVGWIAALIFLTNGTILDYAASGTHITLFLFLATCLFNTLHVMANTASTKDGQKEVASRLGPTYLLAGILTGLLYLTDPLFLWLMPVLIVAVVRIVSASSRRRSHLVRDTIARAYDPVYGAFRSVDRQSLLRTARFGVMDGYGDASRPIGISFVCR